MEIVRNECMHMCIYRASLVSQTVKNLPAMGETWIPSLGSGRSPGEGNVNPLQCSCLENSHERRNLVGYSPWGCRIRYD